mmetsp:Transcript_93988/g.166374  ORF Transcript_93988/g.166374 Transcript_93988/m.166374 type:complete len:148 (-) Transcript_93988:477-920(-)
MGQRLLEDRWPKVRVKGTPRLSQQPLALVAFSQLLRGHRFLERRAKVFLDQRVEMALLVGPQQGRLDHHAQMAQLLGHQQVLLDQRTEMALLLCSLAVVGQTPAQGLLGLACHPGGWALPTGKDQAQQQQHRRSRHRLWPTREGRPH